MRTERSAPPQIGGISERTSQPVKSFPDVSHGDDYLPDVGAKPAWTHLQGANIWRPVIPSSNLCRPARSCKAPLPTSACRLQAWSRKNNILLGSAQGGNSSSSQFPSCQSCIKASYGQRGGCGERVGMGIPFPERFMSTPR